MKLQQKISLLQTMDKCLLWLSYFFIACTTYTSVLILIMHDYSLNCSTEYTYLNTTSNNYSTDNNATVELITLSSDIILTIFNQIPG